MSLSLKQAGMILLSIVVLAMSMLRASEAESTLVFPADAQSTVFMLDGQEYLELGFAGWGPGWAWQSFRGEMNAEGAVGLAVSNTTIAASGANVQIRTSTAQTGPRQLTMQTRITSDRDTDLTMLIAGLNPEERSFRQGQAVVTEVDGTSVEVPLPPGRRELGQQVSQLLLRDSQGRETVFTFEPALALTTDGDLRIELARRLQSQQPVQASLTIDLPAPLTYYPHPDRVPEQSGFDQWYAFTPDDDYETPGEFDMDDWLDAPAGKHGRIRAEGERLLYQDRPIKLWGLNLCFRSGTAPSKDVADRRAALYRKFGINAVRLHKWADGPGWAGIQTEQSALEFDPEGLDLFDYQNAQFRQAGMCLKLSQAFGTIRVGTADLHLVPYAEEFGALDKPGARVGGGNSTLFYSRELQDATIRQLLDSQTESRRIVTDPLQRAGQRPSETVSKIDDLTLQYCQAEKSIGKRGCLWL